MINFEKLLHREEKGLDEGREEFLKNQYLHEKYLIPEYIKENLEKIASDLKNLFPDYFNSITVVGGIANGSFTLRQQEEKKPATDIDFYLVLDKAPTQEVLNAIGRIIRKSVSLINLNPDPSLNAENPDNYLNLNNLDSYIKKEEFDLLALPFICSIGDTKKAQKIIIEKILEQPDKQEIWNQIIEYYNQSLSMHHGSWGTEFNDIIFNEYYPEKIKKYSLPETPEEYMKNFKHLKN